MKSPVKTRIGSPTKAWVAALSGSALLLFVSIGQARQESPASAKAAKQERSADGELEKAPEKSRSKRNPLEHDPDAVAAGRKLFALHCAECHGQSAEGTHKAPSLREPEVQAAAPGAIFWVLTNGIVRHGMPVWSKLPEPQRWQLVTYIKSLGTKPEIPPTH
jgi:mono/diheme cytochrome c family protein